MRVFLAAAMKPAIASAPSSFTTSASTSSSVGTPLLNEPTHFDLVTIGAAFAGLCAAVRGAELGLRTAVPFLTGRGHDA
jgi:hypothetical protein